MGAWQLGQWRQADPTDGSVMIFLTHTGLELGQVSQGIGLGAYLAMMDFQNLAAARVG